MLYLVSVLHCERLHYTMSSVFTAPDFAVGVGEWWDPCDRQAWASSKRMLRAPHPEEGEQADPDQGTLTHYQSRPKFTQHVAGSNSLTSAIIATML